MGRFDFTFGAVMWVDFTTIRGKVVDYTVVLFRESDDGLETIRVYDSAHGFTR